MNKPEHKTKISCVTLAITVVLRRGGAHAPSLPQLGCGKDARAEAQQEGNGQLEERISMKTSVVFS